VSLAARRVCSQRNGRRAFSGDAQLAYKPLSVDGASFCRCWWTDVPGRSAAHKLITAGWLFGPPLGGRPVCAGAQAVQGAAEGHGNVCRSAARRVKRGRLVYESP
jgi:hypothetical protein